jgi:hypothetical protein
MSPYEFRPKIIGVLAVLIGMDFRHALRHTLHIFVGFYVCFMFIEAKNVFISSFDGIVRH